MSPLSEAEFAWALQHAEACEPLHLGDAAQRHFAERFAVYRQHALQQPVDALRQVYWRLCHLLGEASFTQLAQALALTEPPQTAVLVEYGVGLAEFLQSRGEFEDLPYLADLARLEWAHHQAFNAADGSALQLLELDDQAIAQLMLRRLQWQPSVSLLRSKFSLLSLLPNQGRWPTLAATGTGENLLIWRQDLQVHSRGVDDLSAELLG